MAERAAELNAKFQADVAALTLLLGDMAAQQQVVQGDVEAAHQQIETLRSQYAAEKARLAAVMRFQGGKVKLDVGGCRYSTTLTTLQAVEGSMLAAMFSGRHALTPDPEDGSFFIDRDGAPFKHVLNYLRDPVHFEPPADADAKKDLVREAGYYGLEALQDVCLGLVRLGAGCVLYGGFSQLLDASVAPTLAQMFDGRSLHLRLTGSSKDGSAATVFTAAVRDAPASLTLIQSTEGHLFGAYVALKNLSQKPATWHSSPNSFLFYLAGNGSSTQEPFKLVAPNVQVHGGGCGLHVCQNSALIAFCSHQCQAPSDSGFSVAPGYNLPADMLQQPGTLCGTPGNPNYTPKLMEVFSVSFSN